ncbi:uncharacterized protein LOC129742889 [Uranotaenia lowii]|uniref:uncharacterized protein LOC129742889 n=1 Tax=Uranotaenia lowii TaxID=190385 RepID=UPI00247B051A|nr:uncharacterized protein LOC129742889 [Uranotaenia lowii]
MVTPSKSPKHSVTMLDKKRIPLRKINDSFSCRFRSRLLRAQLDTMKTKCSQLEAKVLILRKSLKDAHETELYKLAMQNSENEIIMQLRLQVRQLTAASENQSSTNYQSIKDSQRIEMLNARIVSMRRHNEELQRYISELSQEVVFQKQLIAEHRKEGPFERAQALELELCHVLGENSVLKARLKVLEKRESETKRRHRFRMTQLISKAENLLNVIHRNRPTQFL